jgi:hypothetical protein
MPSAEGWQLDSRGVNSCNDGSLRPDSEYGDFLRMPSAEAADLRRLPVRLSGLLTRCRTARGRDGGRRTWEV